MALNDNAVITAAVGYVFTATPGTAAPTPSELDALDLETFSGLDPAWEQIGHTSREDLPEFGFDGGEYELKGTWQKKRLRQVQSGDVPADYVTLKLEQWDKDSLELYFGADVAATDGVFGVDGRFVPLEKALLIVIVDGSVRIAFYAPKASITRDDSIELPLDDFAALPVKATFLDMSGHRLYDWISDELLGSGAVITYTLDLGGATGGSYVLKVGSRVTSSITYSSNAAAIKTAIAAVDDGIDASQWTVTLNGSDYDIVGPLTISKYSDSTTGGTGIVVTVS